MIFKTIFVIINIKNMEYKTLKIHQKIKESLDGRTQRWLSLNAKIPESELSRKMQGKLLFTDAEVARINEALKTDLVND